MDICLAIHLKGFEELVSFATNWLLLLNALWLGMTIVCNHQGKSAGKTLLAIHHLLFELLVPSHVLIMSVYWSILHADNMKNLRPDDYLTIFHSYIVHLTPGLSALINFLLTDIRMKYSHGKILIPVGLLYSYVNY